MLESTPSQNVTSAPIPEEELNYYMERHNVQDEGYEMVVAFANGKRHNVDVDRHKVEKLQGKSYEGLRVVRQGDMAGHVIDPKHYYQEIQNGRTYKSTIWEMADFSEEAMKAVPDLEAIPFGDYETMKQHLIIEVVSRSENAGMLQNVPHKEMIDLAEVYRCVIPMGDGRSGSILITN